MRDAAVIKLSVMMTMTKSGRRWHVAAYQKLEMIKRIPATRVVESLLKVSAWCPFGKVRLSCDA